MEIHIFQGKAPQEDKVNGKPAEGAGNVKCQDNLQTDAHRTIRTEGAKVSQCNVEPEAWQATGADLIFGYLGFPENPTGEGQFRMLVVEADEEPMLQV